MSPARARGPIDVFGAGVAVPEQPLRLPRPEHCPDRRIGGRVRQFGQNLSDRGLHEPVDRVEDLAFSDSEAARMMFAEHEVLLERRRDSRTASWSWPSASSVGGSRRTLRPGRTTARPGPSSWQDPVCSPACRGRPRGSKTSTSTATRNGRSTSTGSTPRFWIDGWDGPRPSRSAAASYPCQS